MLVGTQVANAHDMPSRFPLLRHWSRTDFFFIYKTGAEVTFPCSYRCTCYRSTCYQILKGRGYFKKAFMNSWPLQPCKVRKKHQLQSNSCHMPWTNNEFQKKLTLPCNIFVLMPDWVFLLQSWKQDIRFVYIFT